MTDADFHRGVQEAHLARRILPGRAATQGSLAQPPVCRGTCLQAQLPAHSIPAPPNPSQPHPTFCQTTSPGPGAGRQRQAVASWCIRECAATTCVRGITLHAGWWRCTLRSMRQRMPMCYRCSPPIDACCIPCPPAHRACGRSQRQRGPRAAARPPAPRPSSATPPPAGPYRER